LNHLVKSLALVFLLLPLCISAAADFDHSEWDSLLKRHINVINGGVATAVDYSAMAADRAEIRHYLGQLAQVPRTTFDAWPEAAQLAFLINAYNAWTVDLILVDYPAIDSIRDIGFLLSSAWNQKIASLFGEPLTLDDIEHKMIRGWGRYKEPRIHFAVNCAAIGCPALRGEAYIGDRLEQQLEDSTKLFLSDRSRNNYSNGRMNVSSIFDWYQEDFERGWAGVDSVAEFLANYAQELGLDAATSKRLRRGDIQLRYLRYDWRLNDIR
jgi:hypothetical protein